MSFELTKNLQINTNESIESILTMRTTTMMDIFHLFYFDNDIPVVD